MKYKFADGSRSSATLSRRAWSGLQLKSVTDLDTHYELKGIASTPELDRQSDIVEPLGAQYSLPIPLLWQHDAEKPIGQVVEANATAKGISVVMQIPKTATSATLKARIDEAVDSVKLGLCRGLSIGFRPIETEYIPANGGYRFSAYELLEISLVAVPANSAAGLSEIKRFDRMQGDSSSRTRARPVVRLSAGGRAADPREAQDQERLCAIKQRRPVRLSAGATLAAKTARPVVRLSAAALASTRVRAAYWPIQFGLIDIDEFEEE